MRDAETFDEFYRATTVRMMRFGLAVTGDLAEAQDLVQEAYARAWRLWSTVSDHPNPEGWIRQTVGNLATDRWRRLGRWQAVLRRAGPPRSVDPPNEDSVYLMTALRRLPAAHRQALALHYLYDLPLAEIAAETGAPIGTVKTWLSRGRAGLAAVLTETTELPHE